MASFNDLTFKSHPAGMGGKMARVFFDNGYGASVIRTPFSYGGDDGLYEIAVLKGDRDDNAICYNTPITEDVLPRLTEEDVTRVLGEIADLPDSQDDELGEPGEGEVSVGELLGSFCRIMAGRATR